MMPLGRVRQKWREGEVLREEPEDTDYSNI
jgi:hypothetical protein